MANPQPTVNRIEPWDVIVIGAGPSGSACAAYLALAGCAVLVLDAQEFPRFQIGESLLPVGLPVLDELGIEPQPDTCLFKRGATFVSEADNKHRHFDFANALDGPPRHAWQVRRDLFDAALLERATSAGASAQHSVKVRRVEFTPLLVAVYTATDETPLHARYVIDASGQGRVLARQFDSAIPYEGFGRAAAFVHAPRGDETHARVFIAASVDPSWRGRGIGRALLTWQDDRARQILATLDPDLPGRIAAYVDEDLEDRRRLYAAAGFSPKRTFREIV